MTTVKKETDHIWTEGSKMQHKHDHVMSCQTSLEHEDVNDITLMWRESMLLHTAGARTCAWIIRGSLYAQRRIRKLFLLVDGLGMHIVWLQYGSYKCTYLYMTLEGVLQRTFRHPNQLKTSILVTIAIWHSYDAYLGNKLTHIWTVPNKA